MKLKWTVSKYQSKYQQDTEAEAPKATFAPKPWEAEGRQPRTEGSHLQTMTHDPPQRGEKQVKNLACPHP